MSDSKMTNKDYQRLAHKYIPGGAHTYSRGDDQFPENAPSVLARGEGARVWDADGNSFLDYGMALRAVTVGYAEPRIAQAGIRDILLGNNLTRATVTEIEAARTICELIPGADMVKFGKNGSSAVTAGVKLARAYTGRTKVARCRQHPFFSYDDWFIGDTPLTSGIPRVFSETTLGFDYNSIESVQKMFDANPGEVAILVMEPATSEDPKVLPSGKNFLQEVQELCRKNGTVFLLDEMITGFRWHLKGACHMYGVIPDLLTFGKGMANGFSVAALAGKREIMELGGIHHDKERVFLISTTHGAEMCGLAAFNETVKVYQSDQVVDKIWAYGRKLVEGMNQVARDEKVDSFFKVTGIPCSPGYVTMNEKKETSFEFRTLFSQEMIKGGVLMPWIAISAAHGEKELDQTLSATRAALKVYARALEDGPTKHIQGHVIKPVFRKFN